MISSNQRILLGLLCLLGLTQFSCQEAALPEPSPVQGFGQYYTNTLSCDATDLIRTSDGGYLALSTYKTAVNTPSDFLVTKTDSLGVFEWSKALGKTDGMGTGTLAGSYVRYDEEPIVAKELPNAGGFIIAGNRSYVSYPNATSTNGSYNQTKIVFYQLDYSGANTTPSSNITEGFELNSSTTFTEKIADLVIDNSTGNNDYVITGYTTNINTNKPADPNNGTFDLTDIFLAKLDNSFTHLWPLGSQAYGFAGEDYGASIQILPNSYLIVGTVEEQYTYPGGAFLGKLLACQFNKNNGTPLNPQYYGDADYDITGGYSAIDEVNQTISIVGDVVGGSSSYTDHIVLLQIDYNLAIQHPNTSNTNIFGFEFFKPTSPSSLTTSSSYHATSIALCPDSLGYVISMTHNDNVGQDICILPIDTQFSTWAGWPKFHGYNASSSANTSNEQVGAVLPYWSGTAFDGFIYSGIFSAGTGTSHLGLVQVPQ